MFRYEKDMIPVLQNHIAKQFGIKHFAKEFNTGNGIADLVCSPKLSDEPLLFNDYALMSLFIQYFSTTIHINTDTLFQICNDTKRLRKVIDLLKLHGYLISDQCSLVQKKKYSPPVEKMYSIEAKLTDWKAGLFQALRYQFFSHKSFLAYPAYYIHRVDIDLFKKYNLGLIAVEENNIRVIIDPKEVAPVDMVSYCTLSERFLNTWQEIKA
jgi:hypothetical protein